MNSRNREENRADLGRVLLALAVLALLSSLVDSPASQASGTATIGASSSGLPTRR
ncbi:MAG TPA: hypothetical protein VEW08_15100 [Steroidobacteraceae bacterium]|nr:hypothetical protein [Steroidobacteraceae bacterium]